MLITHLAWVCTLKDTRLARENEPADEYLPAGAVTVVVDERMIMATPIRVTVWNENLHEGTDAHVRAVYPDGIHGAVAAGLRAQLGDAARVRTATLYMPEHGLTDAVLDDTDVLTWWGHLGHDQVADAVIDKVQARVLAGMGLLVLHSGHFSKLFKRLMGTSCGLRWREADDRELVWTVYPGHPIAEGVPHPIILSAGEMYGEYFDIPQPDELVFISSYTGGEVFRGGCFFTRGLGLSSTSVRATKRTLSIISLPYSA